LSDLQWVLEQRRNAIDAVVDFIKAGFAGGNMQMA
jgi:hypothetical protein